MGKRKQQNDSKTAAEDGFAKGPSEFQVQLLSGVSNDSAPVVVISTDKDRFLVNSASGVQRMCTEHKVRMTSLTSVLLTHLSSDTLGGLPGLVLSTADGGRASIHIVGPSGTKAFERTAKPFMKRDFFAINIDECTESSICFQYSVAVTAAKISSTCASKRANTDILDEKASQPNEGVSTCQDGTSIVEGHHVAKSEVAYVVTTPAARGKFRVDKATELGVPSGKMFGELHAGRPVTLENGTIVTSEMVVGKGRSPMSVMVLPCSSIDFLDNIAQHTVIAPLMSNEQLRLVIHLAPLSVISNVRYRAFVLAFSAGTQHWFSCLTSAPPDPPNSESPPLPPWLANPLPVNLSSPFRVATLNNIRLHYFMPELFPSNAPTESAVVDSVVVGPAALSVDNTSSDVARAYSGVLPLQRFQLLPDRSMNGLTCFADVFTERPSQMEAEKEYKIWTQAQESQVGKAILSYHALQNLTASNDKRVAQAQHWGDVKFTFLGTGCAIPSKNRNASSIHIDIKGKGGVLLDCGEGTYGQMRRLWGDQRCEEALVALKLVWVSHPHADHHLGIVEVLAARGKFVFNISPLPEQLVLVAPQTVLLFLEQYGRYVDPSIRNTFLPICCIELLPRELCDQHLEASQGDVVIRCRDCSEPFLFTTGEQQFYEDKGLNSHPSLCAECKASKKAAHCIPQRPHDLVQSSQNARNELAKCLSRLNLASIRNVRVHHCREAFAVRLDGNPLNQDGAGECEDSWSVCYSGDCRPSDAFIQLGRDCTLCIHEATFEDSLWADAVAKKHCTISEAVQVALDMNAYRCVLTHFSQRYPKMPVLPPQSSSRVVVALDSLTVTLAQLAWAPASVPILQCIFPPEIEEGN